MKISLHCNIYCALVLTPNVKDYKLMNAFLIKYINNFSLNLS